MRLKLQEQPREVLLKLLERPGEVVSREELRSALWRDDTFVDFENGLNTAIKRLRESLGDSADNPIFVETVPRRGYRFMAPVEVVASARAGAMSEPASVETGEIAQKKPANRLPMLGVAVTASMVVVVVVVALFLRPHQMPFVSNTTRLTNDGKAKITPNVPVTDGVHLYFVEGSPFTSVSPG